ncbi:MAG TPA: ammonia-forming cytochrome c nitrite reductase subunit c552 [Woeseiaceae bacterium]
MHIARTPALFLTLLAAACQDPAPPATGAPAAPAAFVGSAGCGGCHARELAAWRGSQHALAMQEADEDSVHGDFSGVEFDYFGARSRFFRRDGGFFVRTEGADGNLGDFRVAYTFGVRPLQQYLVEFPGGRMQALPFAWDTRPAGTGGQRWFHLYPDERIAPGDPLHWTGPNQNWNTMCAECHSTDVKLGYDAAADAFHTTYKEISVGCEACHGPGSVHVAQARAGRFDDARGLLVDLHDAGSSGWIMNASTGIAEHAAAATERQRQPEACGRCHARRATIAPDYAYGRPLADTHLPVLLDAPLYFADGQIHDEVYEYGSFLQSRMYRAGVTCTSCHEPHSAKLRAGAEPSAVCAQCHLGAKFATVEHSGHAPADATCVDCHMPSRTYMQVQTRHDHGFRIPRPDLSVATGAPNACNGCHEDHDAEWAAGKLRERLGSAAADAPHFATALAAGRAGYANGELARAAGNAEFPAIARATAISLLREPASPEATAAVRASLNDPDPLVRIAALRSLGIVPAASRLEAAAPLLGDGVRGVRIEAARALASLRDLMPVDDRRRFGRAAAEYVRAFELTANRAESHAALAAFELASGNLDGAAREYAEALRRDPAFVPARLNYADVLRQQGDDARAGEVLREGIAQHGDDAALLYAYGLWLVRAGDPEAALESLRRAAELDPKISRYTYALAVALNSLGKPGEALALLERARGDFPDDYEIGWALATMRRDAGDLAGARQAASDLVRRFPGDANATALLESLTEGG